MNIKTTRRGLTLLVLAITLMANTGYAKMKKTGKAKPAFEKGSNTLGLSIGFGDAFTYYGDAVRLPAIALNFDHGIINNVGPGTIGIGGVIAYQRTYYDYSYGGYTARWTNFIIGARGTYHLTILKDKNNKFDPYGGVTIGVRSETYSDDYYDHLGYHPYSYGAVPFVGVFVGAKYNFMPKFGAFAELGYDVSFFRIGLNVNF